MTMVPTLHELKEAGKTRGMVIGLGASGRAVTRLLESRGFFVRAVDENPTEELLAFIEDTSETDIVVCAGRISPREVEQVDFVVTSPGVPPENELIKAALEREMPVMSELEAAWQLMEHKPALVVAVTGTNGKSTVVRLLESIFAEEAALESREGSGRFATACAGGNIGQPLSELLPEVTESTALILEVSSFQLYFTYRFQPDISIILNLSPDHMDWHYDFEDYAEAKGRLAALTAPDGYVVLNYEDERVRAFANRARGTVVWFTGSEKAERVPVAHLAYYRGTDAVLRFEGEEVVLVDRTRFAPLGKHNDENLLAAAAAAFLGGARVAAIGKAVSSFRSLPHRMEPVGTIGPVLYVDDSKATNPDAVIKALESSWPGCVVILGGKDKGLPYDELAHAVRERCVGAVTLGEAAGAIEKELLKAGVRYERAETMEDAVGRATRMALAFLVGSSSGDRERETDMVSRIKELLSRVHDGGAEGAGEHARGTAGEHALESAREDVREKARKNAGENAAENARAVVLLSPACSSFDMFESYAHRGKAFREAVEQLRRAVVAEGQE